LPVVMSAKKRALDTVDTSNLRQIGVANEMYLADNAGPASISTLVDSGLLSIAVLSSPSDKTKEGIANRYRNTDVETRPLIRPYRDSYVPIGDMVGKAFVQKLKETTNAGWVVSLGQSQGRDPKYPLTSGLLGNYLRLRYDGGVIRRRHVWLPTLDFEGTPALTTSTHWMFTDDREIKP
jgi:hypothetical protein